MNVNKTDIPHSTSVRNTTTDQPINFTINEVISLDNSKVINFNNDYLILDIGTVIDKDLWKSETEFVTDLYKVWVLSIDDMKKTTLEDDTLYVIGGDPDLAQVIFMNNSFIDKTVNITNCKSYASAIGLIDYNMILSKLHENTTNIENIKKELEEMNTDIVENSVQIAENKQVLDNKSSVWKENRYFLNGELGYLDHNRPENSFEFSKSKTFTI